MACSNTIQEVLAALWPEDEYIIVGVSYPNINNGTPIQPGDQSFTVNTFEGWKARLFRNGLPQFLTNPGNGDTYFDYTAISGEITLSVAAQATEIFICQAVKPA